MATVDFFLRLDGIPGEATDKTHKGEIDLLSWAWGETNSGTSSYGGGSGAGKVAMQDFSFTMRTNTASPKLLLACASGKPIATGTLTCRKAGGTALEYVVINFKNLIVSSFHTGGNADEVVPVDTVTINFSAIQYTYTPQTDTGGAGSKVGSSWDLKTNTGS